MADVKEKCCPFRVFREKTHFHHSQGEATTEKFYDCLGEKCAAYYKGGCLRLIPPALVIDDGTMSLDDAQKLQEELRNAQIMPAPSAEPPSVKKAKEYVGFNSHDCEARYKCPYCGYLFGYWDLFHQKEKDGTKDYCPKCGKEFAK